MKKLLRHLLLIFAAAATLPLASCGGNGDDPDIPPTPTTDYKVETGTTDFDLYLSIVTKDYGGILFCEMGMWLDWITPPASPDPGMGEANESWIRGSYLGFSRIITGHYGENLKIACVGNVSSLNQIKKLPAADQWSDFKLLYEKGGYIVEGTYRGTLYYIRIFIPRANYDATGKPVGIDYEWQQFIPE